MAVYNLCLRHLSRRERKGPITMKNALNPKFRVDVDQLSIIYPLCLTTSLQEGEKDPITMKNCAQGAEKRMPLLSLTHANRLKNLFICSAQSFYTRSIIWLNN